MQTSQRNRVAQELAKAFTSSLFVERKADGFQDEGVWSYFRVETVENYDYRVDGDWLIGNYLAVAEDYTAKSSEDVLTRLLSAVERGGGEAVTLTSNADMIYRDEVGTEPQREMRVGMIAFQLRSPYNCPGC